MPLADFFHRGALAVSQVLTNLDESAIEARLDQRRIAIAFSRETAQSPEGKKAVELSVNLAARLYPSISLQPGPGAGDLAASLSELARAINPVLDLEPANDSAIGLCIGPGRVVAKSSIFVGSTALEGLISTTEALPVGVSDLAFGPGAATCVGLANLFRVIFMDDPVLDSSLRLNVLPITDQPPIDLSASDLGEAALIGAGAVGNAVAWSLARSNISGTLHIVDPEVVDRGNLQRYVLAVGANVDTPKVELIERELRGSSIETVSHPLAFETFAAEGAEYRFPSIVALDSARDRRQVQAALPPWIANAWTQTGDLGVSTHEFVGRGACLACLYLPAGAVASEDQIYAEALGIPEQLLEVRRLLVEGGSVPLPLLELIATRLGADPPSIAHFDGVGIRALYVEGLCGGGMLPLGRTGTPRPDVHVPLAHQSALAGIMLAARAIARAIAGRRDGTLITRINLLRPVTPEWATQPSLKDPRRLCICQDADYQAVYRGKYSLTNTGSG